MHLLHPLGFVSGTRPSSGSDRCVGHGWSSAREQKRSQMCARVWRGPWPGQMQLECTDRIGGHRGICIMRVCTQHQQRGSSRGGSESEPTASQAPTRHSAASHGATALGQLCRAIERAPARRSIKLEIESRTHCSSISVCFPHIDWYVLSMCSNPLSTSLLCVLSGYACCFVSLLEPTALQ